MRTYLRRLTLVMVSAAIVCAGGATADDSDVASQVRAADRRLDTTLNALRESIRARSANGPIRAAIEKAEAAAREMEAIATQHGTDRQAPHVRQKASDAYATIATALRFSLDDPVAALDAYRQAARLAEHDSMARFAIADTYRFDLGDRDRAIKNYAIVAAAPSKGGYEENWRAVVENLARLAGVEIQFLRTNHPSTVPVTREDLREPLGFVAQYLPTPTVGEPPPDHPSQLTLAASVFSLQWLADTDAVLDFVRRHDPAGYLTRRCLADYLVPGAIEKLPEKYRAGAAKVRDAATIISAGREIPGPDARFSSPTSTWENFVRSLRRGDVDAALESFTPRMRRKMRWTRNLTKTEARKFVERLSELVVGQSLGDDYVECYVSRSGEGPGTVGAVQFQRFMGEWKISEM